MVREDPAHTARVREDPQPNGQGQGRPTTKQPGSEKTHTHTVRVREDPHSQNEVPTPPHMAGVTTRTIPALVVQIMYITKWLSVSCIHSQQFHTNQQFKLIFIKVYNAY